MSTRVPDGPERFSHVTWRIPLLVWQFLFVIILIGAAAVFSSNDFLDGTADSA